MSTTHSAISVSGPQDYHLKMFNLVGDRSPLDVLAQTPSALSDIRRLVALSRISGSLLFGTMSTSRRNSSKSFGHCVILIWQCGEVRHARFCRASASTMSAARSPWT